MKMGLLLLVLLLAVPVSLADKNFVVSFHSLGANESITIDLVKYIGDSGPFKHSPVVNVNVVIDQGMATITPKDPKWVGIEDIVFAPVGVELELPETPAEVAEKLERQARRNISVSKEDIGSSLGDMVSEGFFSFTRNMSGEPINITGFLSKDSINLDINDEISFNISMNNQRTSLSPEYIIDIHTRKMDLYLPSYELPSDIAFYLFFVLVLASVVILVAYFYTGYAQQVFKAMVTQERKITKKEALSGLKRSAEAKLASIMAQPDSKKTKNRLRNAMSVANDFFSAYLHISFVNRDKVIDRLSRARAPAILVKSVASIYDSYSEMMYGKEEPSNQEVSAFMAKISNIIRKL